MRQVARGAMLLVALAVVPDGAGAFSIGSPICEVGQLPLVEMSPILSSPPPTGWIVTTSQAALVLGGSLILEVRNLDPERRARGVLIWAKSGSTTGFGQFALPSNGRFQHVPPPAFCQQWSLTHTDGAPKEQSEMRFTWTASLDPPAGAVVARAFVIEDCTPDPTTGCRSHQALTPFLLLPVASFLDGFEDAAPLLLD